MRTIKFRVFDKHKKYMHELDALFLYEKMFRVQNYKNEHDVFSFGTEYFSEPMQFTGILDKNGVEIYEGDILLFSIFSYNYLDSQHNGVVEFKNVEWKLKIKFEDGEIKYHSLYHTMDANCGDIEVIGNIFQHPHLLEANHDR